MEQKQAQAIKRDRSYFLRRVTKSGSSRYISVGGVLPPEWEMVKLYIMKLEGRSCVLRLEQMK